MQATAAAAAPAAPTAPAASKEVDLKQAADFSRRPATRTTTTLATRAPAGTVVDLSKAIVIDEQKTEVCVCVCVCDMCT
jgi:hypothetical protein